MKESWIWLLRYAVVIALALVLATVLGEMTLFKTTRFGKTGLNAARLVQLLGYGGALAVFWLMVRRAAGFLPYGDPRWNVLKSIMVPLTTLIVVAAGQAVLLLVLGPVMNRAWHQAYNWAAIVAIIAAAVWLVAALFTGSASLSPLFGAGRRND